MKYFWSRFKFLKWKDIGSIFLLILAFIPAMIAKIFIRDFWLICEDEFEARDNGYWLFKYIRENHPKQKVAYAINKKSVDYNKVKDLGKIIKYGSISHWFWYLVADKNISSQKSGKPNAAVCYFFEVCLGLRKKNRYFLQHGVIINDLQFLYYKNSKVHRFFTSTQQEYDFIVEKFGYSSKNVKLTGLTRFDNLNNNNLDSKKILVMPTWRNWISKEVECEKYEGTKIFEETEYFKTWNEFLNNSQIAKFLEENELQLIFYPHRNMQKYISSFSTSTERITIANSSNYDVQALIKECALMITDYSSVFFDFAYLGKPIIFYQFDEDKFRRGQYKEGYFNYHTTELGNWAKNIEEVLSFLNNNLNKLGKPNQEIAKKYFKYVDNFNCKRVFEEIKNGNKK